MITIRQEGDFSKLTNFFEKCKSLIDRSNLDKYGRQGVEALSSATPRDTGLTASSWSYEIIRKHNSARLVFKNSNITSEGTPIAILIQYGHATKNGAWVEGIDYINPALKPVFEGMADNIWREVNT
ncbi:MAG: HK97 gp10 family phage protein [Pseudobutyrivibrio sp.]|nr:HK97 gp10 family phage protein [Pseudobutyrivibrio sp.]